MTATTKTGATPVLTPETEHKIGRIGLAAMAEAIKEGEIPIHGQTKSGSTALHIAIERGKQDVVHYLLSKGAPVNLANRRGILPLHLAADSMPPDVVVKMLVLGADPNAPDGEGQTGLHWATNRDRTRLLIEGGSEVDAQDAEGETALCKAAKGGEFKKVMVLLEHGADVNMQNKAGQTPLQAAVEANEGPSALALIAHGAHTSNLKACAWSISLDGLPATHAAAHMGLVPRLLQLLAEGHDPNVVHGGKTAFDEAKKASQGDALAALDGWRAKQAIEADRKSVV